MDVGTFEIAAFIVIGLLLIVSRIGGMIYDAHRWHRPFRWSEY